MQTYHNRSVFDNKCDQCKKNIYSGETIATEYYNKQGQNINVLEFYQQSKKDNQGYHKVFCISCKPSTN